MSTGRSDNRYLHQDDQAATEDSGGGLQETAAGLYEEAAGEFRGALEQLEKLDRERREGARRRELYRGLRRRARRGFRALQMARQRASASDRVEAQADPEAAAGANPESNTATIPGTATIPDTGPSPEAHANPAANTNPNSGAAGARMPVGIQAEQLFTRLLLAGGEGLLDREPSRADTRDRVAGALSAALRTYLQPDDRYQPLFVIERLPGWLRNGLRRLFPVLLAAGSGYNSNTGTVEPTGIDDPAEEEVRQTDFLRLPLSQAKELLAEEIIPALERQAAMEKGAGSRETQGGRETQGTQDTRESWGGGEARKAQNAQESQGTPGEQESQETGESRQALRRARERLAQLEAIRLEPRAKPFVPERGFYTEQITRFSPQGELLVSVRLPGIIRSGTNLDRVRELVKLELVWRLAGKGVCEGLDRELQWVRSRESGSRGSALMPQERLEIERGFAHLRRSFPVLGALDSREGTRNLLAGTAGALARGGAAQVRQRARKLLESGPQPAEPADEEDEAEE